MIFTALLPEPTSIVAGKLLTRQGELYSGVTTARRDGASYAVDSVTQRHRLPCYAGSKVPVRVRRLRSRVPACRRRLDRECHVLEVELLSAIAIAHGLDVAGHGAVN